MKRAQRVDEPAEDSGALSALVVYLRPAPRHQLLSVLVDLGVFVQEITGDQVPAALSGERSRAHLVLVVGGSEPQNLSTIRDLARDVSPAVLSICPEGADERSLQAAGAIATVRASEPPDALAERLVPVARVARSLRPQPAVDAAGQFVFRELSFSPSPPQLERGGRSVPLTLAEGAVLQALADRLGEPVDTVRLEQVSAGGTDRAAFGAIATRARVGTTILGLRRKAGTLGGDPAMLATVRGFGYILRG